MAVLYCRKSQTSNAKVLQALASGHGGMDQTGQKLLLPPSFSSQFAPRLHLPASSVPHCTLEAPNNTQRAHILTQLRVRCAQGRNAYTCMPAGNTPRAKAARTPHTAPPWPVLRRRQRYPAGVPTALYRQQLTCPSRLGQWPGGCSWGCGKPQALSQTCPASTLGLDRVL